MIYNGLSWHPPSGWHLLWIPYHQPLLLLQCVNFGEHVHYAAVHKLVYRYRNAYLTLVANIEAAFLWNEHPAPWRPTIKWFWLNKRSRCVYCMTHLHVLVSFTTLNISTACVTDLKLRYKQYKCCYVVVSQRILKFLNINYCLACTCSSQIKISINLQGSRILFSIRTTKQFVLEAVYWGNPW